MGRKSNEQIAKEQAEEQAKLPQKVKPVITESHRAMPKILEVRQPLPSSKKKYYLHNKTTGKQMAMSESSIDRMVSKYPQTYAKVHG